MTKLGSDILAARKKRYQKRSKLDSSREASISNYEDPPVRPDMVGAELMKTSAKKQAGSKSHLAGPPLAYADSFPSTSKNSNGGMFKKFKKGSSNLLRSRKSVKGQGPGKFSVTSGRRFTFSKEADCSSYFFFFRKMA